MVEDSGSASFVGRPHLYSLIEPAGSAQGRVDIIGSVGRGDNENVATIFQTIEQGEQLRDHAFLILGIGVASGDGQAINLVEEDDGRCE